mgnify:CR=1 FL=1
MHVIDRKVLQGFDLQVDSFGMTSAAREPSRPHPVVQILEIGMAIQNNDIERYVQLLPVACVWFKLFRATNYANACQVFWLQWMEWDSTDHPLADFLRRHFKACSEEYGESAIHVLMTHIREWDYTGPNMKRRWIESSLAANCFEFFEIPSSHRGSSTKWYSEDECGDLMLSVCNEFIHACHEVSEDSYLPLRRTVGYRDLGDVSEDIRPWTHFLSEVESIGILYCDKTLQIRRKLRKPLQTSALQNMDHDLFF